VTRFTLNLAGRHIKLEDLIFLGRNSIVKNDVVAETFEAVVGAVYTDSSRDMVAVLNVLHSCGFVKNILQAKLDELLASQTSPAAITPSVATTPSVASPNRQSEPRNNPSIKSDALRGAQTGDEMLTTPTLVEIDPATVRKEQKRVAKRQRQRQRRLQRLLMSRSKSKSAVRSKFAAQPKSAAQPASAVQPTSAVEPKPCFETATARQDLTQQLGQLRTMIQETPRVESNLAWKQPLRSLGQSRVSIQPELNHYNSANSSDTPSPVPDDTATVIPKTGETVGHVQFPIEGLAQPEDGVSLESAFILNSGTLAVLHLEERNGGIRFLEEASSPSTASQRHELPRKLARLPSFLTMPCPYYPLPELILPPFQSRVIYHTIQCVFYPMFYALSKPLWRRDSMVDGVETPWPYSSDTVELYPTIEQGAVAMNAEAEDASAAAKATSTEAEPISMELSSVEERFPTKKTKIALQVCLINVANSGYGHLQTAVGATVSSHTGEANFEDLLKASGAKAHIVAAMRISATESHQKSTALHRQRFVDQELSKKKWRSRLSYWFVRAPDPELQEVLAARMVAYVIARWQYMYPLPEKAILLAHLGLANTMLDLNFKFRRESKPGNDMDTHSMLSILATKGYETWFPNLKTRSDEPPTRILWILGSNQSRLEETIGPLEDLDLHRYLVFRAVEQFLRSDIRSRYTPDPKPEDTDSNKSNFDKFHYKSSSATAEFDSSKSDSPDFNEPRSDMHGLTSNEFDDIFVSTLTTDLPSHDDPNPVIPTSNKPSSGSSKLNSPQTNNTAHTKIYMPPSQTNSTVNTGWLPPLLNNPGHTKISMPNPRQRRMLMRIKREQVQKRSKVFPSRFEPNPTPAPPTTIQVRRVMGNVHKTFDRHARWEERSNERADEGTRGRWNNGWGNRRYRGK
jgi:hypothetical protein